MNTQDTQSLNKSFGNGQGKNSNKLEQLKAYIRKSPYIEPLEQPKICNSFGVPFMVTLFRKEYTRRFYEYLKKHTTTVSTVSKDTRIHQKYLCQVKKLLEDKGLLKVVKIGKCPTTGARGVQFLSTNPEVWESS